MLLDQMHPEDVKAAIRKRFGTIGNFIKDKELPPTGVADLFRGRSSRRVRDAVEELLQDQERSNSIDLEDSEPETVTHRLSGAER